MSAPEALVTTFSLSIAIAAIFGVFWIIYEWLIELVRWARRTP